MSEPKLTEAQESALRLAYWDGTNGDYAAFDNLTELVAGWLAKVEAELGQTRGERNYASEEYGRTKRNLDQARADAVAATTKYWVEQKVGYGGQVFLHGVVLGFTRGQWPIAAFAADEDGGCSMGARWAAQQPHDRVLVGPVRIPDDAPVRTALRVPERFELTEGKEATP